MLVAIALPPCPPLQHWLRIGTGHPRQGFSRHPTSHQTGRQGLRLVAAGRQAQRILIRAADPGRLQQQGGLLTGSQAKAAGRGPRCSSSTTPGGCLLRWQPCRDGPALLAMARPGPPAWMHAAPTASDVRRQQVPRATPGACIHVDRGAQTVRKWLGRCTASTSECVDSQEVTSRR